MASHASQLVAELLAAFRANHTHHNLATVNSTVRVVADEELPPYVSVPWVSVGFPEPIEIEPLAITPLTQYQITGTIVWVGFVAGLADTTESRGGRAADLAYDLTLAVQTAQTNSATYPVLAACTSITQRIVRVSGDASNEAISYGFVQGELVYTAIVAGGV